MKKNKFVTPLVAFGHMMRIYQRLLRLGKAVRG
jgi:hypothetical protein